MLNRSSSQASMDPWAVPIPKYIYFFTHSDETFVAYLCLSVCCMHFFLVTESNIEVHGIWCGTDERAASLCILNLQTTNVETKHGET